MGNNYQYIADAYLYSYIAHSDNRVVHSGGHFQVRRSWPTIGQQHIQSHKAIYAMTAIGHQHNRAEANEKVNQTAIDYSISREREREAIRCDDNRGKEGK